MKIYNKRELAMLYFPGANPRTATNRLARWIRKSDELREQLREAGYRPANRLLTVRQLEILYSHLGEP